MLAELSNSMMDESGKNGNYKTDSAGNNFCLQSQIYMINDLEKKLTALFCTPPAIPANENEIRHIKKMESFEVPCNGNTIRCYSKGNGPSVIISHGWGSRAGHLLLLSGFLAGNGFRAVIYDAPGHNTVPVPGLTRFSTMYEFGKALGAVTEYTSDVCCIVGHSLGAMSAVFAMAEYPGMNGYSVCPGKAVLINCPSRFSDITANFSRTAGLDYQQRNMLENDLEKSFALKIEEFSCVEALKKIKSEILIIQDKSDQYFSENERLASYTGNGYNVLLTEGFGHDRVLGSREVFNSIISFLD